MRGKAGGGKAVEGAATLTTTTTTTTRFATEIDPVAAVLQRLRMLRIARNVSSSCNTVRKQAQLHSGGGGVCRAEGEAIILVLKSQAIGKKLHVSDRAGLAAASSKCDLTKWVNMPPKLDSNCTGGLKGRGATRNLPACVGLTIGEISSKTIKN